MTAQTTTVKSRFGRVESTVSPLGLGTYHLTSDRHVQHADALELVRAALDLGINVIDTAPMYGLGEAEQIVGEALRDHPRADEVVLVNKVGRFEKGILARLHEDAYSDPGLIRAQFEHSLRTLGVDRIPLLLIHESDWAQWWDDRDTATGPVMSLLDDLRAEGSVGAVGLSVRDPQIAAELCGTGRFDAMLYVHYYNMIWQEAGDAVLPAALDNDMGVALGAIYRQGLLTSSDAGLIDRLRHERRPAVPPGIVERIESAHRIAADAGISMMEMGLRWLLSDERVQTVLVGPRNRAELEQNVEWAERGPLESSLHDEISSLRDIEPGSWAG